MDSYSYEDIYELLRNEKFSSDLQEFSSNNLKKIQKYFEERIEKLNETNSSNMFTSHNKLKIQSEVDNATRMVNDLIYHREKKIITRARFTSRSDENIEDTSNMTDLEKSLYNFLNAELKKFRTNYLNQILDADITITRCQQPMGAHGDSLPTTRFGSPSKPTRPVTHALAFPFLPRAQPPMPHPILFHFRGAVAQGCPALVSTPHRISP